MQNGTPQNGLLRIRLPNRDQQPHPTPQVSLQMPACRELDPVFVVCVRASSLLDLRLRLSSATFSHQQ